ncbi:MAG: S49 family peptidase [Gemmataceae bacterium]|nr:S49 family peptidase [Gemmataceae bacterium]MDW8265377.1 S49 family peptidase [Gemmataceae bacterium]
MNSDPEHGQAEGPPYVIPVRYGAPVAPPRPSILGSFFRFLLVALLIGSLGLNLVLLLGWSLGDGLGGYDRGPNVVERFHSGDAEASDKIALVRIEGIILDGEMGYAEKQIERAARDPRVKAVVLQINSPGGSITASDELHRQIVGLRDGRLPEQVGGAKPVVVAMEALAASGGYYIAVPAQFIMAQRTTITGSIGVYAAFPNIAEFCNRHGIRLDIIKAGEVKDSGSMFHPMSPQERQLWQDMVDHAYRQFLSVVEAGRPALKGKLREPLFERDIPNPTPGDGKPETLKYVRRLADGGIFTADEAKKYGLIDGIGFLDDAIAEARKLADPVNPNRPYRVVSYERPLRFRDLLLGSESTEARWTLEVPRLAAGSVPRLWYLTPQSELAGLVAILGR